MRMAKFNVGCDAVYKGELLISDDIEDEAESFLISNTAYAKAYENSFNLKVKVGKE